MVEKLGDLFRSKREEMSLTLKEVENATSIRMLYLQAIEEGRALAARAAEKGTIAKA